MIFVIPALFPQTTAMAENDQRVLLQARYWRAFVDRMFYMAETPVSPNCCGIRLKAEWV